MLRALRVFVVILACASARAGTCRGDDPCKACRDCSACRWCDPKNPRGGSCGTLRDQDAKAAAARMKKRR